MIVETLRNRLEQDADIYLSHRVRGKDISTRYYTALISSEDVETVIWKNMNKQVTLTLF